MEKVWIQWQNKACGRGSWEWEGSSKWGWLEWQLRESGWCPICITVWISAVTTYWKEEYLSMKRFIAFACSWLLTTFLRSNFIRSWHTWYVIKSVLTPVLPAKCWKPSASYRAHEYKMNKMKFWPEKDLLHRRLRDVIIPGNINSPYFITIHSIFLLKATNVNCWNVWTKVEDRWKTDSAIVI